MNLKTYIESIGVEQFAKQFKVSRRAAESYRYGARRPKPELAQKIVAKTGVTWEAIYPRKRVVSRPSATE